MEKVDRNKEILELAQKGEMTYAEIGAKYNISRQMIQTILRRMGFRKREPQEVKDVSADQVFDFILETKKQWSGHGPFFVEICEKFGISTGRVDTILESLIMSGKINIHDYGVNRKIIVVGSTWNPPAA